MEKIIRFSLIILSFLLLGCSYKNEFGQNRNRFNFEKIKPNNDDQVYSIIDTTKLYREVSITDENRNPVAPQNTGKDIYLKFYKNGRVAEFWNINFNNVDSFNPKYARSYLYNLKKNILTVQIYFRNPQCGQCFIKEKLSKISEEIFELQNDHYIYTYQAQDIPAAYLKYNPDW